MNWHKIFVSTGKYNTAVIFAAIYMQLYSLYALGAGNDDYSISVDITWDDVTYKPFIVYTKTSKGSENGDNDFGFYLDDEWKRLPWLDIKSIKRGRTQNERIELEIIKKNGDIVESAYASVNSLKTGGYYKGIPADAKDWRQISNIHKREYIHLPNSTVRYCHRAGGCNGEINTQWGVWDFYAKNGEVFRGLIMSGFGLKIDTPEIGIVDHSPENVIFSSHQGGVYVTRKFDFNVTPAKAVSLFDFSTLHIDIPLFRENPEISVEFVNNMKGNISLTAQQRDHIMSNGYIVWSKYGNHQVQCIVRVHEINKMELVNTDEFSKLHGHVKQIYNKDTSWRIKTMDGEIPIATNLQGHQKQNVPVQLPQGKYLKKTWIGRPPTEPGIVSGTYVVSPNEIGYCLIPMQIIDELLPSEKEIVLSKDASGKRLKFSRFHPGDRWVSSEFLNQLFIDDDIDSILSLSKMWFEYKAGDKEGTVRMVDVLSVKQLE